MSFIEFKNICKKYPGSDKNTVDNFNLNIEEKEFIAFVGPSGCGKTTLLSLLGGLDSPTNGHILFNGTDIEQSGLGHHRKKHDSFILQSYNLID